MKPDVVLVPEGQLASGSVIPLDDEEVHHLEVRRSSMEPGILAMDGAGRVATGTLQRRGRAWDFAVDEVQAHPAPPATTLLVGAGDRDRLLWLAEKCTELGVLHLVPFTSARTAGVASRLREGALPKLRRRAREACKQSGNPWACSISEILTLPEALAHPGVADARLFLADPDGGAMPAGLGHAPCAWIIGPEGGLVADELRHVREELAAVPVTLAPWVLRFETAAVAAAAATNASRHRA